MYSSCVFGSVSDSEFPILFKECILLSGSILVDFNYLCQESTFTSQNGKLLEIQDLTSLKYYIQKINPPEPWNRNEPNIICFSKSQNHCIYVGNLKSTPLVNHSQLNHLFGFSVIFVLDYQHTTNTH